MDSFGFFSFALLWLGLPAALLLFFNRLRRVDLMESRVRHLEGGQHEVNLRLAVLERAGSSAPRSAQSAPSPREEASKTVQPAAAPPEPEPNPEPQLERVSEMSVPPELGSIPSIEAFSSAPAPEPAPTAAAESEPEPTPAFASASTSASAQEPAPERLTKPWDPQPASIGAPAAFDWERFVGVKLFAWLGGLALFFAAAFGLNYSIEHNLFPPALRALGGFVLGSGLVTAAWLWRREGDRIVSQSLGAAGVLILYSTVFACRVLFHFEAFSLGLTFLLMSAVTAVAFTFAVRRSAQVIAVLGMLGGFLTPVMLSSGVDSPGGLFGYIAILNVGLLAVVRTRRWNHLLSLAAVGTAAMQIGWFAQYFEPAKMGIAQAVFLGFPMLFFAGWTLARREGWLVKDSVTAPALLALVSILISFNLVLSRGTADLPGHGFAVAFGADFLLLLLAMSAPLLASLEVVGAVLVFLLIGFWNLDGLRQDQMPLALALPILFSALHTVGPLALRRLSSGASFSARMPMHRQLIPALGLLMLLIPILRELSVSYLLWGCVLVVNCFAMALAWVAGAVFGLLAVFVFSTLLIGTWLVSTPMQALEWTESLVVVGGAAVVFLAFSAVWLPGLRSIGGIGAAADAMEDRVRRWMPSLSALMPFALLILLVLRFSPENPTPVFAIAAALVAVMMALVRLLYRTTPPRLLLAGLIGTTLLEAAWIVSGVGRGPGWTVPVAWFAGFHLAFLVYPFWFSSTVGQKRLPWVVGAMSGPLAFLWVYARIRAGNTYEYPGWIPALFAIPSGLALIRVWLRPSDNEDLRLTQRAWMGGVTLLFLTLIFPVQFHRQWLTLGWALEGAALCALVRKVPHAGLRRVGLSLLVTSFVRLMLHPAVWDLVPRAETRIFNPSLYTFGTVILALFGASRWLPKQDGPQQGMFSDRSVLAGLGTVLLFVLVNIEIADWFSPGVTSTFEFSANLGRDLAHTICWGLFAFGLIVLGILRGVGGARYAGLGLLVVTLGKLFLHDLAQLGSLYRIAAFAGVAVIAMVASFLYQRFLGAERPLKG